MSSFRAHAAEAKGEHGLFPSAFTTSAGLCGTESLAGFGQRWSLLRKRYDMTVKCWRKRAKLRQSGERREKVPAEEGQKHEGGLGVGFLGGRDGGQACSLLVRWLRTL